MNRFKLVSPFQPQGDQVEAIRQLIESVESGARDQPMPVLPMTSLMSYAIPRKRLVSGMVFKYRSNASVTLSRSASSRRRTPGRSRNRRFPVVDVCHPL